MSAQLAYVMNDSLTPTKMDSRKPISPSNYPDKKSMVNAFKRMMHQILDTPEDRDRLHKVLKEFHRTLVVEDLMEQLKPLLNSPQRRKLYLAIRPLVPARVRTEYNSLIPHVPTFEKKVVHLKQAGSRSMGFKIRGGKEFGCGIFVSSVQPASKASQAGLKVGDEIIRINGLILSESTHEEAVNVLMLKKSLTLNVRCVGMIPEQDVTGKLCWKTVEERKPRLALNPMKKLNSAILRSTKKIQITLREGESLGASIKTVHDKSSGVFITELRPNSIAYEQGLKIGDELIEVNGESLVSILHRQAVALLKSSNSLMLTIRNKDPTVASHLANYDPLANPPEDFEMNPHDIDLDAELIPTDLSSSYGFVLRSKDGKQLDRRSSGANQLRRSGDSSSGGRPLTDLDMEHSNKNAPTIASPAAYGFGPSVAMPTLLGMMPQITNLDDDDEDEDEDEDEADGDVLVKYLKGLSPKQAAAVRESMALPDLNSSGGQEVLLGASFFANQHKKQTEEDKQRQQEEKQKQQELQQQQLELQKQQLELQKQQMDMQQQQQEQLQKQAARREGSKISGADLASYQFPVEDDTTPPSESSATKNLMKRKKTPYFQDKVEIIETKESLSSNSETFDQPVHPSNMEFSDSILKGRKVAFHTIPKTGPIKIAIRGGTDTPLGGAIFISRILEGGAAAKYGKLNVGDQILVCDGVNLIDVSHDEAAQALKKAMDMDSRSIDLVVAVDGNTGASNGNDPSF